METNLITGGVLAQILFSQCNVRASVRRARGGALGIEEVGIKRVEIEPFARFREGLGIEAHVMTQAIIL